MASLATSSPAQQQEQPKKLNKYGSIAKNNVAVAKRITTTRLNSTSTLFVSSTLAQPNNKTTIRSVAESIQQKVIVPDVGSSTPFDEPTSAPTSAPTVGETEYVIRHVFKTGQLSVDCNIIALVYLDRLKTASGIQITPQNWRPLVVLSLMMASKIWDDLSMINEDFSTFLHFSLKKLNAWEVEFLKHLSFNVRVAASEYARYYFSLRGSSSSTSKIHEGSTAEPLNMESAHRLEALSVSAQSRFLTLYGKSPDSSGSVNNLQSQHSPLRLKRSVSDPTSVSGGAVRSKAKAVLS